MMEKFKVEGIEYHHQIKFELKEPTILRVVALLHKHIEFDLELNQIKSDGKSYKMIDSSAKDFEDSIFVQLDKGSYSLRLIFVSEAYFLNQPC